MKIKSLKEIINCTLRKAFGDIKIDIDVSISPEGFGDFSTTVPFKLAKIIKRPPIEVAEIIKNMLPKEYFEDVVVAKPGYINFILTKEEFKKTLEQLEEKNTLFFQKDKNGIKVQVEFVSANPTGPLHIGNGRGGIIGDVLSNVLSIEGYDVEREYYVNDSGSKMELFAKSIYYFYLKKCGKNYQLPEEGYKGKYIEEIAEEIYAIKKDSLSKSDEKSAVEEIQQLGKELMISKIRKSLGKFGIKFDNFFFESSLYKSSKIKDTLDIFMKNGYAYEKDNAIWFKSAQFGDDKDRVLLRSNGEPTYTLSDAAYHRDKWERGFVKVIDVWGADHFGHIVPMKSLMLGMGFPKNFLDIIIYQVVHLYKNGVEIMMSKHTGTFVTLDELVDEVGKDAARFFFLLKSADTHLNFDINLAKEQSMNNPVYYVQYTYARINNILQEAKNRNSEYKGLKIADLGLLIEPEEKEILKRILYLEEELDAIGRDYSIHRLPFIALEFSQKVNSFYQKHKVLGSNEYQQPRLALVSSSLKTLSILMDIMGIEKKEKM